MFLLFGFRLAFNSKKKRIAKNSVNERVSVMLVSIYNETSL